MPESYKRLRDPPPILVTNRRDPFLTKCCCFSLRLGCFLSGWFTTITAVLYLVSQIAFLSLARSFLEKSLNGKIPQSNQEEQRQTFSSSVDFTFAIGYVIVILIFVGTIASNVVMLYGAYKKRPVYLRGYVYACLSVVLMATVLLIRNMGNRTATPLECFIVLLNMGFTSFSAFIASCYRTELLRDQETPDQVEVPLPCNT